MEKKYYKVGETFDFEGIELEVVKETDFCTNCYFEESILCDDYACFSVDREDEESVVFKEIGIAQPFLNKLGKQALSTALSRGKNMDNFIEDLQSEIAEFKSSNLAENTDYLPALIHQNCNISNEEVIRLYERDFKNTSQDELMDIIITCMSKAEDMGIDIDTWIQAKMKYNSLRRD